MHHKHKQGLRRSGNNGAPKPAYYAAATVQNLVGRRAFVSRIAGRDDPAMEFILAFGPNGDGPPPVTAAGLEAGDAELFAVWTLSTVGGTSRQTGSQDSAYVASVNWGMGCKACVL